MGDLLKQLFDSNAEYDAIGKEELAEVFCRNCGGSVKINANYAKHIDAVDSCPACRR